MERELSNVHTFKEQLHPFVNEIRAPGQLAIRSKSLELGPEVGGRHLDNGEDRIDESLMVSGIGLPTLQALEQFPIQHLLQELTSHCPILIHRRILQ